MLKFRNALLFLLISFIFVQSSFAEKPWIPFTFLDNTGGLNDATSNIAIQDNEASDSTNVIYPLGSGGAIQKRFGYAKINPVTISGVLTGIQFFKKSDGSNFIVGVGTNQNLYAMSYSGGDPTGIWNVIGQSNKAITQNDLSDYAIAEDNVIIEDGIGTTPPFKWSGSGSAVYLNGSPPNATMVAYHKTILFAAGNSTNPSRLYASNLGDINTWTATDNLDIETNDGSIIRDIEPGLDALYIWKDKSIWRLSGTDRDNFVLERMVDGFGTLSRKSVARVYNSFIFVTQQGDIALYDGGINIQIISTKVKGTIDNANFSRFQYSPGIFFDRNYYLSFSNVGSSTHDKVLIFNTVYNAWSKFAGIKANAFTTMEDSVGKEFLVFADYNGYIYKYPFSNSDDGQAIQFSYVSKNFNFPQIATVGGGIEKIWRLLRVFADSSGNYNLDVETRSDFETSGTVTSINLLGNQPIWGTAVWGQAVYGSGAVIVGRVEVNKTKDFFQVKFSNNNASEPVTIRGYQFFIQPTERI